MAATGGTTSGRGFCTVGLLMSDGRKLAGRKSKAVPPVGVHQSISTVIKNAQLCDFDLGVRPKVQKRLPPRPCETRR
jgi:hypothetical protein